MINFMQFSAGLIVLAAIGLMVVGVSDAPVPPATPAVVAPSLPVGGLTLVSTTVELPAETAVFPDLEGGPGADAVNANCVSCHSASMAMNQPALTAAQWGETVTKMAEVFKAPIAPGDRAAIVAYLAAMSEGAGKLPAAG